MTGIAEGASEAEGWTTTATDFEGFYLDHRDRIARALALTLGNDELARDAAAEAMARAYQKWNAVTHYDNPAGWVYRVGLNWANSRLRKWRREITTDRTPDAGDTDPDLAEPRLAQAMAALSTDHRSVVVLRYYLDWSEAETAAALSVPPGTVKSRLSRALSNLARALGVDDEL